MLPLHPSTTKCSPWVPSCCLWFMCCFKFNLVACSLIVFSDYSSSPWPLNSYRAFYTALEISLFFLMVFLLKFTYSKIYFFGYSSMSFDKCLELWNYHHNQDRKQFNHPSKICHSVISFKTISWVCILFPHVQFRFLNWVLVLYYCLLYYGIALYQGYSK